MTRWNPEKLAERLANEDLTDHERACLEKRLAFARDMLPGLLFTRAMKGRPDAPEYQLNAWYELAGGDPPKPEDDPS